MFKGSCIYTWVNLNFAEWNDLMFPQKHIFLFTEDEPIYSLPFSFHFPFNWKNSLNICRFCFRESMKLGCKKKSTISELSIPLFYVDYPIFSQLKYPLFMFWTFTSIPYLFKNNCASIGRSRATPMGGIGETVLVSINMPFSRRCRLSLHAALPLFFTTILQSAMIYIISS